MLYSRYPNSRDVALEYTLERFHSLRGRLRSAWQPVLNALKSSSSSFDSIVVGILCVYLAGAFARADAATAISQETFGQLADGAVVKLYTMESKQLRVRITDYGGRIVSLEAPDRHGNRQDVVLGFDTLDQYVSSKFFFGALVGRYANRIAGGRFTLAGRSYETTRNSGENTLHGGRIGFNKRLWQSAIDDDDLVLHYVSVDGEEGFPGNLNVTVRYRLRGTALTIDYAATTDQETVVNLTNHSYFNLAGAGNGDVLDHRLKLLADRYTPVDASGVPTGELRSVAGTVFDFRRFQPIGSQIDAAPLRLAGGYDVNFVLDPPARNVARDRPRLAAIVREPRSGRMLEVLTTEPGLQFYTGNTLDGSVVAKEGRRYGLHGGFCLETQHFPDSPNEPDFPSTVLRPGEMFHSTTIFRFGVSVQPKDGR
jgi:aldose 1-epimerase